MKTRQVSGGACLIAGLVILGLLALYIVVVTGIFMLAWNAFMVTVFGLPAITFWQAFAGVVILNIVGGAFRAVFTRS